MHLYPLAEKNIREGDVMEARVNWVSAHTCPIQAMLLNGPTQEPRPHYPRTTVLGCLP